MRISILVMLLCLSPLLRAEWHSDSQDIMGTRIELTVWHTNSTAARHAIAAVMDEMRRIDARFSPYRESSELSEVNRQAPLADADRPLAISAELARLLEKSLYYGRLTEGAFDISFGSLGRYYNYREGQSPTAEQQEQLLPSIDYRLIHLDSDALTLYFSHPKVYVDLGGIAKGYAVDRAIELLASQGIAHASISAGGDSRVLGDRRGRPWMVGVKNPRDPASVAITLPLENAAISTSGDYERYFVDSNGQRVHHILNPRTGQSATGITSVSIIGPAGFDTDPLSTAVFVMGTEKGLALLNQLEDFDGIIITAAGKVYYSEGLMPPE